MDPTIVVIRPYKTKDYAGVHSLIVESTLSHVNQFFLHALNREIYLESVLVAVASMFVLTNLAFYWIVLSAFPIVAIAFYVSIWVGHYYKAYFLHPDLKNIESMYLGSDRTCFWVAEAFGASKNATSVKFVTEAEIPTKHRSQGEIIGTIAIMNDKNSTTTAWLRSRLAVKLPWRNHGIGSKLLDTCIKFCELKSYNSIALITTECHLDGRKLYAKKGFTYMSLRQKRIFKMPFLSIPMYFMILYLKEKKT